MVIRKPYAFLIKNFRIIHFIIFGILFYLFFKSYRIYSFINGVSKGIMNRRNADGYISYSMLLFSFVLIILFGFIYYLMKHKDKPKIIYLVSIIGYLFFIFLLLFSFNYFNVITDDLVDQKIIRIYRDFYRFMLCYEVFILLFMLIRALGFDIKKFDFKKDLCELDLSSDDAEEVEISLDVDANFIIRFFHRFRRKMGYYLKENVLVISIIFTIILIIITFSICVSILKNKSYYNIGEYFNTNRFRLRVNDSYITSYNFNGDDLENNYVIVSFNIKGITDKKNSIDSSSFKLKVSGKTYYPLINKCGLFNDLGACYKYKTISNSVSNNYILIFDVDDNDISKKMKFLFDYGYSGEHVLTSIVELNNINLDEENNISFNLNDKMSLDLFGHSEESIIINSFEFGHDFLYDNHNFNVIDDKIILKLSLNSSFNISNFFNKYIYIGYDDSLIDFKVLEYNNNFIFLEVDKDISNFNKIWIDFRNRGKVYKYYLVK